MDLPSFDGSAGDAECSRLASLADGAQVLELGSLVGRSTIAMARTARHVTTVDLWQGGTQDTFTRNIADYGVADRVTSLTGNSSEVVSRLPAESFDMVFVDADHSYAGVKRDLEAVARVVKPGGVIACHDYVNIWNLPELEGVHVAIDEFCAAHGWHIVDNVHSMVVLRQGEAESAPVADTAQARLDNLIQAIEDPALRVTHACPGHRCRFCGVLRLAKRP